MNTKFKLLILLISILFSSCTNEEHLYLQDKLWKGVVAAGKDSVTIYFAFDKNFFGNLQGKISIPDQSLHDIEASTCNLRGDSLFLEFSEALNAKVHAKVGSDKISGAWEQGGHTFALNLKQSSETILQAYMDRAMTLAEHNSVYKQTVDWKKLREEVTAIAKSANNIDELVPAFQLILRTLNDKHGFVMIDNDYIKNEINNAPKAAYGHNKEIVSAQLSGLVGYVRIPTFTNTEGVKSEEFNQKIQSQICKLIEGKSQNWIIDLRLNEGGTMFPMLGGLNKLLDDGEIGAYVDADRKESTTWIMKDGNYYNGEQQTTTSGKKCKSQIEVRKIAVLTGPLTASSGEAVAIALHGMQNTKHFGEPTRGRSTGVPGYGVGKNITFFFSTSFYADRKGQIYKNGISPDVLVTGGDNFAEIEQDSKVHAALKWIQE
ncbi:S41 family peptidase [Dyadobacter sp. CY312]|uniref:S41 family peptidase n=1 Tax=Dyadobacter sp. CY312 TaxID=2907303 RepID=UPI001F3CC525|nr:S41 family peptidase [Dyadobacter sp. CY312]MCE7040448.1 S41 family peptidase [Dyadobacter sp. CY312]